MLWPVPVLLCLVLDPAVTETSLITNLPKAIRHSMPSPADRNIPTPQCVPAGHMGQRKQQAYSVKMYFMCKLTPVRRLMLACYDVSIAPLFPMVSQCNTATPNAVRESAWYRKCLANSMYRKKTTLWLSKSIGDRAPSEGGILTQAGVICPGPRANSSRPSSQKAGRPLDREDIAAWARLAAQRLPDLSHSL